MSSRESRAPTLSPRLPTQSPRTPSDLSSPGTRAPDYIPSPERWLTQRDHHNGTERLFKALQSEFSTTNTRLDHMSEALVDNNNWLHEHIVAIEERVSTAEIQFGTVNQKLDKMDQRQDAIDERLDRVEERLDRMDDRLDRVEERLDRMDGRLDRVEQTLNRAEARLDRIEDRLDEVEAGLAKSQREWHNWRISRPYEKLQLILDKHKSRPKYFPNTVISFWNLRLPKNQYRLISLLADYDCKDLELLKASDSNFQLDSDGELLEIGSDNLPETPISDDVFCRRARALVNVDPLNALDLLAVPLNLDFERIRYKFEAITARCRQRDQESSERARLKRLAIEDADEGSGQGRSKREKIQRSTQREIQAAVSMLRALGPEVQREAYEALDFTPRIAPPSCIHSDVPSPRSNS